MLREQSYECPILDVGCSSEEDARSRLLGRNLSLGVWHGKRLETTTHWLRWWNKQGELLLWGSERLTLEQEKTQQERQRAQ